MHSLVEVMLEGKKEQGLDLSPWWGTTPERHQRMDREPKMAGTEGPLWTISSD